MWLFKFHIVTLKHKISYSYIIVQNDISALKQ